MFNAINIVIGIIIQQMLEAQKFEAYHHAAIVKHLYKIQRQCYFVNSFSYAYRISWTSFIHLVSHPQRDSTVEPLSEERIYKNGIDFSYET